MPPKKRGPVIKSNVPPPAVVAGVEVPPVPAGTVPLSLAPLPERSIDHRDVIRWVAANWTDVRVGAVDAPSPEAAGLLLQVREDVDFRRHFYSNMYMKTMSKDTLSSEEARFADDGGVLKRLDTFLNGYSEAVNGMESIARNNAEEMVENDTRRQIRAWRSEASMRSESELAVDGLA